MVKNLDFNCVRNFWQKAIVYMISLIYICLDCYQKYVFHKPWYLSSTIFMPMDPMVTLRQPLKKKEPIRNEPNQPELCKAVRTCSAWPRKF